MAPFQKKAATVLRDTSTSLAKTNAHIVVAQQRREAALLADDVATLDDVDGELAVLQTTARRQAERAKLLEQQAAADEANAVSKRRQQLRDRFAKKLAESDDVDAVAMEAALDTVLTLYRRIIQVREDCRASWPTQDSHTGAAAGAHDGAALSANAVRNLLSFHLYRISADPFVGGSPGETRNLSLPGATCPRLDWQLTPDRIEPFADALKRASAFAVDAMTNTLDPLRAVAGQAVAPLSEARSDAELKLAALLKQQAELANDITPEGEARYMEVVAEIANLSEATT